MIQVNPESELEKKVCKILASDDTFDYTVCRLLAIDPIAFAKRGDVSEEIALELFKLQLRYLRLPTSNQIPVTLQMEFHRLFVRLGNLAIPSATPAEVLAIDEEKFRVRSGVGVKYVRALRELKQRLLDLAWQDSMSEPEDEASIGGALTIANLDEELRTFMRLLLDLKEHERDLLLARFGIGQKRLTLYEVGQRLGFTESRAQQKESQLLATLRTSFTYELAEFQRLLSDPHLSDLRPLLPQFFSYFSAENEEEQERNFYLSLGMIFEISGSELWRQQTVDIRFIKASLCDLFSHTLLPCEVSRLTGSLIRVNGLTTAQCEDYIKRATSHGLMKLHGDTVLWVRLGEKAAAAQVLLAEKGPLHWQEVFERVNKAGYTVKPLDPGNDNNRSVRDNDYLIWVERGSYMHIAYSRVEEAEPEIVNWVHAYLNDAPKPVISIWELYQRYNFDDIVEYYEFVNILERSFPEHLDLSSNRDQFKATGGDPSESYYLQLLKFMREKKRSVTKVEISRELKWKVASCNQVLNRLLKSGQIIRVDSGLYDLTEVVRGTVDLDGIRDIVDEILRSTGRVVEADYFRQEGNGRLGVSYTKEVYACVAQELCAARGWHYCRNLFSRSPLSSSLLMILAQHWREGMSASALAEAVADILLLSDDFKRTQLGIYISQLKTRKEEKS